MHRHNFINNTRLPALHNNRDKSHNCDISLLKYRYVQKSDDTSYFLIAGYVTFFDSYCSQTSKRKTLGSSYRIYNGTALGFSTQAKQGYH